MGISRLPRPTETGWALLAVTVLLLLFGLGSGRFALQLLFGLCLSSTLLSLVAPRLNLIGIRVERRAPPEVFAGEPFPVTVRISGENGPRDRYGLEVMEGSGSPFFRPGRGFVVRLRRGSFEEVTWEARIRRRGRHQASRIRIRTSWPFGFFAFTVEREAETEILVFPRIGRFRKDPLPPSAFSRVMTSSRTLRGEGREEFRNLRDYRAGDNLRLVAWRASARRGELLVRELEDDLTKRVTIFLESRLRAGSGLRDRLRLERAISFTATLVKHLVAGHHQVRLLYFGPEPEEVYGGRGARGAQDIYRRLAVLVPAPTRGIEDLVSRVTPESLLVSKAILVLPTEHRQRLALALKRLPSRRSPLVYRCDGEWERSLFLLAGDTEPVIATGRR